MPSSPRPRTEPAPPNPRSQATPGYVPSEHSRNRVRRVLYHVLQELKGSVWHRFSSITYNQRYKTCLIFPEIAALVQNPAELESSRSRWHRTKGFLRDGARTSGFCAALRCMAGTEPTLSHIAVTSRGFCTSGRLVIAAGRLGAYEHRGVLYRPWRPEPLWLPRPAGSFAFQTKNARPSWDARLIVHMSGFCLCG